MEWATTGGRAFFPVPRCRLRNGTAKVRAVNGLRVEIILRFLQNNTTRPLTARTDGAGIYALCSIFAQIKTGIPIFQYSRLCVGGFRFSCFVCCTLYPHVINRLCSKCGTRKKPADHVLPPKLFNIRFKGAV